MTSDHVTQHKFLTANKNIRAQSNKMLEMIKCQKPTARNKEFKQDQKVQGQYTSHYIFINWQQTIGNKKDSIYNITQNVKYLGINLTKNILNFFSEKYKTLLREMKGLSKW